MARKPLKGSPNTEAAYRGDLVAISAQLATDVDTDAQGLRLGQVTAKSLRRAFAAYSDNQRDPPALPRLGPLGTSSLGSP